MTGVRAVPSDRRWRAGVVLVALGVVLMTDVAVAVPSNAGALFGAGAGAVLLLGAGVLIIAVGRSSNEAGIEAPVPVTPLPAAASRGSGDAVDGAAPPPESELTLMSPRYRRAVVTGMLMLAVWGAGLLTLGVVLGVQHGTRRELAPAITIALLLVLLSVVGIWGALRIWRRNRYWLVGTVLTLLPSRGPMRTVDLGQVDAATLRQGRTAPNAAAGGMTFATFQLNLTTGQRTVSLDLKPGVHLASREALQRLGGALGAHHRPEVTREAVSDVIALAGRAPAHPVPDRLGTGANKVFAAALVILVGASVAVAALARPAPSPTPFLVADSRGSFPPAILLPSAGVNRGLNGTANEPSDPAFWAATSLPAGDVARYRSYAQGAGWTRQCATTITTTREHGFNQTMPAGRGVNIDVYSTAGHAYTVLLGYDARDQIMAITAVRASRLTAPATCTDPQRLIP